MSHRCKLSCECRIGAHLDAPTHDNTLYPDNDAKRAHSRAMMRFYNAAERLLNHGERLYTIRKHFNPGGIAVWGETYAKIYLHASHHEYPNTFPPTPIVEAYDCGPITSINGPILIRQWDGRNSGHNNYVQTLEQFVTMVRELQSKPFVRF
jgi:hypothetical protein